MQANRLFSEKLEKALQRQKYQFVGRHSAVKKCRWLHRSLVEGESCYKHKFYGIMSWRCIQMTPAVAHCNMRCVFCWRVQPSDISTKPDELSMTDWDNPAQIVEECILAQHRILSGYKSHSKIDPDRFKEALEPKHAAISLAGEPTLYPDISGLLREFQKRDFTSIIVTNGTRPKILEKLDEEPSQLYISVCAPDEKVFTQICRPQIPGAWKSLNQTLELLPSFKCPTVMRLTIVRGLNTKDPKKYARLIDKANPTYVEPKAYVFVGMSRRRLAFENMPTHSEIRSYARELGRLTGYNFLDESKASRVVLLSRLEKAIKLA